MNCKTLYDGPTNYRSLMKTSKKVLYAIAACIFENSTLLPIRTRIALLRPDCYSLANICKNLNIDHVKVVEQYKGSIFYKPYACNFRVRLYSNAIYSVYSSVK